MTHFRIFNFLKSYFFFRINLNLFITNRYRMKWIFRSSGKCILFGEHAVVYGRRALAASLAAFTEVTLERISSDNCSVRFIILFHYCFLGFIIYLF